MSEPLPVPEEKSRPVTLIVQLVVIPLAVVAFCVLGLSQVVSIIQGMEGFSAHWTRSSGAPACFRAARMTRIVSAVVRRLAGCGEDLLARVVDGDDVGVAEAGDGDGFAAEALCHDGVGGEGGFQQFHRDLSAQLEVGGDPHLSHATLRESSVQLVALGENDGGQRRRSRAGRRGRHVRDGTLVEHRA